MKKEKRKGPELKCWYVENAFKNGILICWYYESIRVGEGLGLVKEGFVSLCECGNMIICMFCWDT